MTVLNNYCNSNIKKLKSKIKAFELLKKSKFKKIVINSEYSIRFMNKKIDLVTQDINFFKNEISHFSYGENANIPYSITCLHSIEKIEDTLITAKYNFKLDIPENKSCKIFLPDYSKWKFKNDSDKVNFDNCLKEFFYKNKNLKFSFKKSSYMPIWLESMLIFG